MGTLRFSPHTVTFDCWQTLIFEQHGSSRGLAHGRKQLFATATGVAPDRVKDALTDAWRQHQRAWHRRVVFAAPEMTEHALRALGVTLAPAGQRALVEALESEILNREICAIEGTRELMEALRAGGVRTALICDTGFTPGRVVRQLLARVGLLDLLEVQIFSDEVRFPKPHPLAFTSALDALAVPARGAVHVGDLRRSDVAGARAVGMGSVRFRGCNDDSDAGLGKSVSMLDCAAAGCEPICARPEADAVVDTYRELTDRLSAPA
jgi:putative hydrolase of the HAD superfamily